LFILIGIHFLFIILLKIEWLKSLSLLLQTDTNVLQLDLSDNNIQETNFRPICE
jgi:hypothetical protein